MIGNRLKTMGAVVVLSVLVWVLAESQTLRSESLVLNVVLSPAPDEVSLVRVTDGSWTGQVHVTLAGSASLVSEARDRLGGRVELVVGRELPGEPGDHAVSLREALRRTEALKDLGVNIVETRPEVAPLTVVRAATRRASVVVRAPTGALEGPARAEPMEVTIRGPEPVMRSFGDGSLEVVATIEESALEGLRPGVVETIPDIRVQLPEVLSRTWGVAARPQVVDVSVQVRTRTRSHTIPRLPVQVVLPPPELGRWRITLSPEDTDLFDVVVSGPSEGVAEIESGASRPMAVVSLSFQELEAGITSKTAQIVLLPAGVTARVEDLEVGLTIERVETSAGDPASP